jgi:hypothetical protein
MVGTTTVEMQPQRAQQMMVSPAASDVSTQNAAAQQKV